MRRMTFLCRPCCPGCRNGRTGRLRILGRETVTLGDVTAARSVVILRTHRVVERQAIDQRWERVQQRRVIVRRAVCEDVAPVGDVIDRVECARGITSVDLTERTVNGQ